MKFLVLSLVLISGSDSAYAKKMYRWVDESGNVYFSDQVPPEQVQYKRETLSNKAKVLDVVEKAKTPEQIALQKRLNELRKEQEKIIAKQLENDKVLLSTYRNMDDMKSALQNKILAFDSRQKATEANILRLIQQLEKQQEQAAEHERNARNVPEQLVAEIANSNQQIEDNRKDLGKLLAERQSTENEFKADMIRFGFLTQSKTDEKTSSKTLAASNAVNALGLFICQDAERCDKAWKIAGEFVAMHSTTGDDVETDKLIMRASPVKNDDLSLSVSKLQQNGQEQIFLDIRCKQSPIGAELCASQKVQEIRQGFSPYLQSHLASMQ
jgi:hypothetical protein